MLYEVGCICKEVQPNNGVKISLEEAQALVGGYVELRKLIIAILGPNFLVLLIMSCEALRNFSLSTANIFEVCNSLQYSFRYTVLFT